MANLRVDKITSTETFETTGSVQFDGSGDYLETTLGAFGTSEFTIEYWISPNFISGSYVGTVRLQASTAAKRIEQAFQDSTLQIYTDTGTWRDTGFAPLTSQWTHIALVKYNNKLNLYANGSSVWEVGNTRDYDESFNVDIGSHVNSLNGNISNVRIINGKALYTANFKPPMRELEVTPETVLLCCQSKTDTTLEKTGKTITVNGNAVASELTPGILTPVPKSGGGSAITGSVEFNGTNDYLTVPNTTDLRLADSDFTIEFWATISKVDSTYSAFALFENSSALRSYQLEVRANGAVRFEWWYNGSSSNNITTGTGVVTVNQWNYYAVSRNGTTLKLFINGIEVGSSDVGTNSFFNNTVTPFMIGGMLQSAVHTQKWQGNISNLRIVKGTALYTDSFIPPTRELKRVPGTVLLCCQDPDSALTEATGKTITGYGDLHEATDVEMLTNGSFAGGYSTEWEAKNNANLSHSNGKLTVTSTQNYSGVRVKSAYLPSLVAGRKYVMTIDLESVTNTIRFGVVSGLTVDNISTAGRHSGVWTASAVTEVFIEKPTGSNSTFVLKSVSIRELNTPNGASNFTPQVGDDRKVTFEGVTKINSDAYFYLPTGNTESRYPIGSGGAGAGTRGVMFGGYYDSSPNRSNVIDYVTIASTGNAVDFGDRLNTTDTCAACASATRALNAGGYDGSATINTIEYVTIASTGNASKFGELDLARRNRDGCSSSTRGLFGGGYPTDDAMEYVTIATSGISSLFGNLTVSRYNLGALASPVRGVFGGGTPSTDTMDFVTIATTADAIDFGNLTAANGNVAGTSSETRGIFGFSNNVINYITIASTGDAIDFGDLNYNPNANACTSSLIRGIFMGGGTPARVNTISYITIASTGNAVDFGDLTQARQSLSATSSGHGGLG